MSVDVLFLNLPNSEFVSRGRGYVDIHYSLEPTVPRAARFHDVHQSQEIVAEGYLQGSILLYLGFRFDAISWCDLI